MNLTAKQGTVVLNPRHVTRVVRTDQDKRSTANGEREYRVMAYQGAADCEVSFALDFDGQPRHGYTPGWSSEGDADWLLSRVSDLITEAG